MADPIWVVSNKEQEKFLRKKTQDFDFSKFTKKETRELIERMKKAMYGAHGIGLSANQIGLPFKVFVAGVPQVDGPDKFYAVFNPVMEKASREKVFFEQGCLSVPGVYGEVEHPEKMTVSAFDKNGKPIKHKIWGLTAYIFQHEIDHLNGVLFIDKAKNKRTVPESLRLKKREEKIKTG